MTEPLTLQNVGRQFALAIPRAPKRIKCVLRQHKNAQDAFSVFRSRSGDELWKCFQCDPPDNRGDAIALYARLADCDRNEAFRRLKDLGFAMPDGRGGTRYELPDTREERSLVPLAGKPPEKILELDLAKWTLWADNPGEALAEFARSRGLDPERAKRLGMIEMPKGGHVGFTYVNPATGLPCRVKVRAIGTKSFFCMPLRQKGDPEEARSLGPLYLGQKLKPTRRVTMEPVIVTEGEIDALSLELCDIPNVVSLPDGASSVSSVDLRPLRQFRSWLVATDNDEAGEAAYRALRERGYGHANVIRVRWRKLVAEELVTYKDANAALLAGFTRDDFVHCLNVATEQRYGFPLGAW